MPSPMEERARAMMAQNARGGTAEPPPQFQKGMKGGMEGKGFAGKGFAGKDGGKGFPEGKGFGKDGGKGFFGDGKGFGKDGGKGFFGDGKGFGKDGGKGFGDGKGFGKGFAEAGPEGQMVEMGKGFKGKGGGQEMVGYGKGGQMVQERIVYQRKSRNAGIHTIEIYTPQFYFSQTEMEEFDARPDRYGPAVIGKYTKGIGQIEGRFPTDDEDPTSFAMTVVHRLVERMEAKGINETGMYQPDGVALNVWNAIGRIDVGTESITDRSKSMKSFIMDLFERYGNESNIEGVDQYNACYGGQACGLCTLSWVESDRWDGRYGIAVATDISEAHPAFIAFAGAATTATLFFPDAPMPHHSQRASCVLHRFDFFKPVGWHDMSPLTDGKYSVECYLEALDACHKTLRKKLNDREILQITDYNVFHTGGGYHIVRKAFERLVRLDRPGVKPEERDMLVETKLAPSVSLLKIIGPCHTVSSFLNTSSVIMNTMEKSLGKVICVFTYGSGCAASMYQMRVDDIPYFDHLELWKLNFYRDAIKLRPEQCLIHQFYVETWMKFDYTPHGRQACGISPWKYQKDVHYLMEIDKFGRRFYHRGGITAGPIDKKYELPADHAENRRTRKHWGPIPDKDEGEQEKSTEEVWKAIEYNIIFDKDAKENYEVVGQYSDPRNPQQKVTIRKPIAAIADKLQLEPDGLDHYYQIVGTWNRRRAQDLVRRPDGSWTIEVVLGENRWEEFYLIQDGDPKRRIYPHVEKAAKEVPTVGPHDGGQGKSWLLDGRDRVTVPPEEVGMPGDKYQIEFRWEKLKILTWKKLQGEQGSFTPGQYFLSGIRADKALVELKPEARRRKGWFSAEIELAGNFVEFKVVRNEDPGQTIYPVVARPGETGSMDAPVAGPDDKASASWRIEGEKGTVYKIAFYRDPEDCEPTGMRLEWRPV